VSQLRAELESSLSSAHTIDLKRRLAEKRAVEAEQEVQEARQVSSRVKTKLTAIQEECECLQEALHREKANGVRLRQQALKPLDMLNRTGASDDSDVVASDINAASGKLKKLLKKVQEDSNVKFVVTM
jgi:hypothetical protein